MAGEHDPSENYDGPAKLQKSLNAQGVALMCDDIRLSKINTKSDWKHLFNYIAVRNAALQNKWTSLVLT